jgi:hypothetical protein
MVYGKRKPIGLANRPNKKNKLKGEDNTIQIDKRVSLKFVEIFNLLAS